MDHYLFGEANNIYVFPLPNNLLTPPLFGGENSDSLSPSNLQPTEQVAI